MGEQLKRLDRIITKLQTQHKIMFEIFANTDQFQVVKHNSPIDAASLAISFESPETASAFEDKHQLIAFD